MHQWELSTTASLARFGSKLANELSACAKIIVVEVAKAREEEELRRIEWEEQRRKFAIEEELRKRNEADKASRLELMKVIEQWSEIRKIEAFFDGAQRAIESMPEASQAGLIDRLVRAQSMIGSARALDALQTWKTPDECYELIKSRSHW